MTRPLKGKQRNATQRNTFTTQHSRFADADIYACFVYWRWLTVVVDVLGGAPYFSKHRRLNSLTQNVHYVIGLSTQASPTYLTTQLGLHTTAVPLGPFYSSG